jgi:hypothetical protein
MMPIVTLKSGKRVRMIPEFGPSQSLRAAELADVPARMSLADSMIFDVASTMVAVDEVDLAIPGESPPKGFQKMDDLLGRSVSPKEVTSTFRSLFTDLDWRQLDAAFKKLYSSPKYKAEDVDAFQIED